MGWAISGLVLAALGLLGLVEEPSRKIGRMWFLPFGPLAMLAGSWGALALSKALWLNSTSVAWLGRVMSVPLFAMSMLLFFSGLVSFLAVGSLSTESGLALLGGIVAFPVAVLNFRVAQKSSA